MTPRDSPAAEPHPPALAALETASIARGMVAVDALLKRADVALVRHHPVSPGRYLIVLAGPEQEVAESLAAAAETAGDTLVDRLYLAHVHPEVPAAVARDRERATPAGRADSIGIVETDTVCSALLAADAACKAAEVRLGELRLARGVGGKAFFTLTGTLDMVQAAVGAAAVIAGDRLVAREVIARPHEDLPERLSW